MVVSRYAAPGYDRKVNYYSNTVARLSGNVMGDAATADNARVLTERRFLMQGAGDESRSCADGSPGVGGAVNVM